MAPIVMAQSINIAEWQGTIQNLFWLAFINCMMMVLKKSGLETHKGKSQNFESRCLQLGSNC